MTPAKRDVTTRTCIGCRRRAPAAELTRLVLVRAEADGRVAAVTAGERGRRSGRGASLHPRQACVAAAVKARAFGRAFRQAVVAPMDGEGITAFLRDIEIARLSEQRNTGRTTGSTP